MRTRKTTMVLYSAVLAFLLSLLTPSSIKAADFDIICNDTSCSGLSGPIFSEAGVLPGDGVSKTISLQNDRGEILDVGMELTKSPGTDDPFTQVVEAVIRLNSSDIYSGDLFGMLDTSYDLGNLSAGNSLTTTIELFFPESAGNEYQKNSAKFDISFIITGEDGDTEVISTETTNEATTTGNQSTEEGSALGDSIENGVIGKILGLSDTGSDRLLRYMDYIGAALLTLGLYLLIPTIYQKLTSQD